MSGRRTELPAAVLETTWGAVTVAAGPRGVAACHLPEPPAKAGSLRVRRVRLPRQASRVLRQAAEFARVLLEGRAPGRCPRIDAGVLAGAPDFRRAVWRALQRIPHGRTATYAGLARAAGRPRAARAAGSACGANPLPLFIPCHRAVAAGGRLGGFSSGLAWKVHLLNAEGGRR